VDKLGLPSEQPVDTPVDKTRKLFKRATALCFIFMILYGNYLLILNLTGKPLSGAELDIWLSIVGLTCVSAVGYIFLSAFNKFFGQKLNIE